MSGRSDVRRRVGPLAGALLLGAVLVGPWLAPLPTGVPVGRPWSGAEGGWLGTDHLGRDVWSRTLAGGRRLLVTAVPIGLVTTALGAGLGLLSSRVRWLGRLLGPVTATVLAVPGLVVVLGLALLLPAGLAVAAGMLVLGVPLSARVVAAAAAGLRDAEFLRVARRRGERALGVVLHELLPALSGTVVADAAVRVLAALQLLVGLHVLGFGPPPPAPDWAVMVRDSLPGVLLSPASVAAPAVALCLVCLVLVLGLDELARRLSPAEAVATRRRRGAGWPDRARPGDGAVVEVADLVLGSPARPLLTLPRLSLAPGEVLGLQGPSGAGKSTLLQVLAGAPRADLPLAAARLELVGEPLPAGAGARRRRRRRLVGWCEQDPARTLDPHRTVLDVVADGRALPPDPAALLASVGLAPELAGRPCRTLSGGQAARVALLRAVRHDPPLLVVDEPTAALDPSSAGQVGRLLRSLAGSGTAVLVVSHDARWLHGVADRVLEVAGGGVRPVAVPSAPAGTALPRTPPPGPHVARWQDLRVEVAGRPVLAGVDLEPAVGELVAVVAPSGTGKSTLLRALVGDPLPTALTVHGHGLPVAGRLPSADARRRLQLVAQDSAAALNPGRGLLSQVRRHAEVLGGWSRPEADRRARQALAAVGLGGPVLRRRPGRCSGGERQRAALARGLVVPAEVLLLDEPTSALDPRTTGEVLVLLRERARTSAVVVVTHEEEVAAAADRVLELPLLSPPASCGTAPAPPTPRPAGRRPPRC